MNLIVDGVAKVSRANILLESMTVLAGENGTGKSTISRALMVISSLSMRMPELIMEERISSILRDAIGRVLSKFGAQLLVRWYRFATPPKSTSRLVQKEFWSSKDNLLTWLVAEDMKDGGEISVYPKNFLESREFDQIFEEICTAAIDILDVDDSDYERYILKKRAPIAFMDSMFHVDGTSNKARIGLYNSKFTVEFRFEDGQIIEPIGFGAIPFPTIFYSEPENRLDHVGLRRQSPFYDRYSIGRSLTNQIFSDPQESESKAEDEEYEKIMGLVNELSECLHGRLKRDERGLFFSEIFTKGECLISLGNMASGNKTMSTIMRLLENKTIKSNGLMIIDEPESNLHPEHQLHFARFLVNLCLDCRIKLLVNTHSPYFLRALQKYSDALGIGKKVHYYTMVPDEEKLEPWVSSRTYHTDCMDNNLEEVYAALARPLEEVM